MLKLSFLLSALLAHGDGYIDPEGAAMLGLLPGHMPAFTAVPASPSTVERVGIPGTLPGCGAVDEDRAPELTLVAASAGRFEYELRYGYGPPDWPEDVICPGAPPPDGSFLIDVGLLPAGEHVFRLIGLDDEEVIRESSYTVQVGSVPSTGISGPWYAQEQSGRGVFVARLSSQADDPEPLYALYWATHDADGEPVWVVAAAESAGLSIAGEAFNTSGTPLAPGAAPLTSARWGTLQFEYTGCGTATMTWNADDPRIADGSIDVTQLARTDGIAGCRIADYARHPLPAAMP